MASDNEREVERLQAIVDKYRIEAPTNAKRRQLTEFIIWLAKENIALCDHHDILSTRQAFEKVEEYCND